MPDETTTRPAGTPALAAGPQAAVRPVHTSIPGRARFKVPAIHRRPLLGAALERHLRSQPGIIATSANSWSATVLIRHEHPRGNKAVQELIREAVAIFGRNAEASSPPPAEAGPAPASRYRPTKGGRIPTEIGEGPDGSADWWRFDAGEAADAFGTDESRGLSTGEISARRARYGPNALPEASVRGDFAILLDQFRSLPTLLLLGSAALSVATGGLLDAALVAGVVAVNAAIGFVTERGAERTIRSLATLNRPLAHVRRGGTVYELPVDDIVPGDVLLLFPGTIIPADARILNSCELTADESALTGESVPVMKSTGRIEADALSLADRINMVFRGTAIVSGRGIALAVATGSATEIGRIQALVATAEHPQTPLQRQLDRMGRQLTGVSLGFCGLAFAFGIWRGIGLIEMLRTAAALAVAAVPEGLPTVATVTLALGIREMQRHNVLVRRLDAVETLGAVSVICFDKTGTLTVNRMAVTAILAGEKRFSVLGERFVLAGREAEPGSHPELIAILRIAALCNESEIDPDAAVPTFRGSPTENALLAAGVAAGLDIRALRAEYQLSNRIYRSETRRFMVTVHQNSGSPLIAIKGSPDEVLARCRYRLHRDGSARPLSGARREAIEAENHEMGLRGLRVLGFAYARLERGDAVETANLIWLGLIAMADPTRPGTRELMHIFHRAGIRTAMITGDQSATAYSVAKELELSEGPSIELLDSTGLDRSAPEALVALAPRVDVFARVSPAHKLEIVRALQGADRVVAMTGDGINDGPALRRADIGVAMGRNGTDAAREIADVVLADDELPTMIVAVRQGRTIYRNIRKSLHFLLATNGSELLLNVSALGFGLGLPLTPIQLLWLNLVTDVLPALALGVEPPEPDILAVPPRARDQPVIGREDYARIAFESGVMSMSALAAHLYGIRRYGPGGGGVALTSLVLAQLLHAFGSRSEDRVLFRRNRLPRNRHLTRATLGLGLLQGMMALLPPARRLLGIAPLGPADIGVIAITSALPFVITDATKMPRSGTRQPAPAIKKTIAEVRDAE